MPSAIEDPKPTGGFTVDSFDASTASADKIVRSIARNGGCFLRGLVDRKSLDTMVKEVKPYLEADVPWEGDFFPPETRRVNGLPSKSPSYTEKVLGHPLFVETSNQFLTTRTSTWIGDKEEHHVSLPQLNSTTVLAIGPGARAQSLHRDDSLHHTKLPKITADQYTMDRDTALGIFLAATETTVANGATRFIPGSHLDNSSEGPGDESKTVYAVMEPGDAFLMLASCFHGGSANTTDQTRMLFGSFMCRGYLRQEENQFLANPIEEVKKMPENIQRMIGYSVSSPYCGWVDLKDPIGLVRDVKVGYADL
ncbi:phytanoyl-CoA dioxygenase family protein [Mytilinidion resinicola]|uniref:Phytanoyl-CoA dioxygenase family protein n=1 Tax=Mytilinidion resinicola TaxID=574789 RepID=A0A6A6Z1S7_9PEZI|nr:phytanoyl-CoA dioxygenase family protein [Mytilinidion resinicola]KAF2815122.1 phytanoyl-CoA dioxygenase family protein [Mytilinidion resinicola]